MSAHRKPNEPSATLPSTKKPLKKPQLTLWFVLTRKTPNKRMVHRGKNLYCFPDNVAGKTKHHPNCLLTWVELVLNGAFEEADIKRVVKAPEDVRPEALIPIGVPNEAPPARGRRGIGEVMHKETF